MAIKAKIIEKLNGRIIAISFQCVVLRLATFLILYHNPSPKYFIITSLLYVIKIIIFAKKSFYINQTNENEKVITFLIYNLFDIYL